MKLSLKDFKEFKQNFKFKYLELKENEQGIFLGENLIEDKEGNKYWVTNEIINLGYNSKNSLSKILSNLYSYTFKFRGKKVKSIEGVLQSLKYKDKKLQKQIWQYSGLEAYHTRGCNTVNFWGNEGILYWQGTSIKRESEEYQDLLDELYLSCAKNIVFRTALLETGDKILTHHIGHINKNETVLTRYEYELRINALREYIKSKL